MKNFDPTLIYLIFALLSTRRRPLSRVGGVAARGTIPLFFSNSKISAVGDLGRETQGKGPTEEGKWPQRPNISRTSKKSAGNTQI